MFKSFFPKPGPFFISAFIWSLLAVIFWQAGGGDWLLRVTGASQDVPISAARFWSLNYLVFYAYYLFCVGAVRAVLVCLLPAPLAVLVDSRHLADHLRHLVSGGSRGGDQRLVCAVLRPDPERAEPRRIRSASTSFIRKSASFSASRSSRWLLA